MRRLSMKSKRRKSETTSDSGSEENGVAHPTTTDSNDEMKEEKGNEELETSVSERTQSSRKAAAKRRPFRGRHSQKATSEEPVGESYNEDDTQVADTEEEENGNVGKGGANKRRKKEDQVASTSSQDTADTEKEYEVEKIVGQRTIKGRRQFLVRWKGYNEDSDTWEQEKDLNCLKLIEEFLAEDTDSEHDTETEKPGKTLKSKSPKTDKKSKKPKVVSKKQSENDTKQAVKSEDDIKSQKDNQKEFEVEKILEVRFKKNKTRDFLIRWKGFSSADDTWEPEENLNCPELIEKFMQKVEKAKTTDMRELRANRAHTKRYTLTTHESGRRLSRRNMDKQRATYHECDE